jgi:hypothetical protein
MRRRPATKAPMPIHMSIMCEGCRQTHFVATLSAIQFRPSGGGVYRLNCPPPCAEWKEFQKEGTASATMRSGEGTPRRGNTNLSRLLNDLRQHAKGRQRTGRSSRADGRDRLDRALEAVEGMPRAGGNQFETLVIVIPANFAYRHTDSPLLAANAQNCRPKGRRLRASVGHGQTPKARQPHRATALTVTFEDSMCRARKNHLP